MKKRVLESIQRIEMYICIICLSLMTIITFINVLSRRFLNLSLSYTEEVTGILFIIVTMVGAAISASKGQHMGLSVLTDRLPRKANKLVILVSLVAAVFFCVLLAYFGFEMVYTEYIYKQKTPTLGLPEWIYGLSIPLGGLLLLIHFMDYGLTSFSAEKEESDYD